MNTEDIISMAREAGFNASNGFSLLIVRHSNGSWVDVQEELSRFAKLAYEAGAAAEREACARYFEYHWRDRWTEEQLVEAIRARKDNT